MDNTKQLSGLAKEFGLPETASPQEILDAVSKDASGSQDPQSAFRRVRGFIDIPLDSGESGKWLEELSAMLSAQSEATTNAKRALADAIANGRLGMNDTGAHKVWLASLTAGQATPALLNSARGSFNPERPPATLEFVGAVRAEQAAGASLPAAVDAAQKTHPEAYRAWLRAGGGSL